MGVGFAIEVERLKEIGGLATADLARATGADETTVRAWGRGSRSPSGARAERLTELSAVVERLTDVMDRDYVRVWLLKPNGVLDDDKPLDIVAKGRYREVSALVSALAGTAMS